MVKELSNVDISLFALYQLGGVTKKVHTEDITWEAYNLAKERFSWRLPRFRKMGFPDKTTVRYSLEAAKKNKNGNLVLGKAGGDVGGELEGWRFTPAGVNWIKKNERRITKQLKQGVPDIRNTIAKRFVKKIKSNPYFQHYKDKKTIDDSSQYMFTDMLVCAPDASKNIIKQKFEELYFNAELVNDLEILMFLKACKEKYKKLIA